jgi:LysR family transcriptional regulator, hca operon transcriptional activator
MHCRPSCNTSQASSPERYIATRLIERGGRRLQLTPASRVFLDEARLALAQAERATERVRHATRANIDRLTLGFLWGSEIDLMMRVMTTLHGELDGVGHAQ